MYTQSFVFSISMLFLSVISSVRKIQRSHHSRSILSLWNMPARNLLILGADTTINRFGVCSEPESQTCWKHLNLLFFYSPGMMTVHQSITHGRDSTWFNMIQHTSTGSQITNQKASTWAVPKTIPRYPLHWFASRFPVHTTGTVILGLDQL